MGKRELVDLAVELRHETELAYLVSPDGITSVWVPKSQCDLERQPNGAYILICPEWLAEEKKLT